METSDRKPNLEQIFSEAEERFRQGITSLTQWSEQARHIVEERPGALVASIAIAGFMTGLVLRQGKRLGQTKGSEKRSGATASEGQSFFADPVVVFITSAIAGFAAGPKMVQLASDTSRLYGDGRSRPTSAPMEHH